jgi:hypothetical protein
VYASLPEPEFSVSRFPDMSPANQCIPIIAAVTFKPLIKGGFYVLERLDQSAWHFNSLHETLSRALKARFMLACQV